MRGSRQLGVTPRLEIDPRLRWALAGLVVIIALAAVVTHALEYRDPERFAKDFALEYVSAKAILNHANPYAPMRDLIEGSFDVARADIDSRVVPGRNWHPPFKFVLVLGLAGLPFEIAGILWLVLSACALAAGGYLVASRTGYSKEISVLVGLAFVAVPVAQKDLSLGQVNGLILLLLAACWTQLRQKRDTWAGVALGIAVAVKVFPVVLLLPLIAWGRKRAVVATVASAGAMTLASAFIAGVSNLRLLLPAGRDGFDYWNAAPTNISLWGLVNKWLRPNPWTPNAGLAWLATTVGIALIAALVMWLLRRTRASGVDSLWTWVAVSSLVWPIAWDHYLVLALPWIVIEWRRRTFESPLALAVFGVLCFAITLGIPPGVSPLTGPVPAVESLVAYQIPAYALLAVVLYERVQAPTQVSTE